MTQELLHDPLAEIGELQQRVNAKLGRDDLSCTNISVALEQIPYHTVRDAIRKQLASGKSHYKEEPLLQEMMTSASCCILLPSVGSVCIPRTTNAIERFFRTFNQFYKKRCGFFTVVDTVGEFSLSAFGRAKLLLSRWIKKVRREAHPPAWCTKMNSPTVSVVSAKRELILFLVMYVFIRQPESGKAPIESI